MSIINDLSVVLYYVVLQFGLIFPYWIIGLFAGSLVSVFAAAKIRKYVLGVNMQKYSVFAGVIAALLGAASPMCMYGTVPLIAVLGRKGVSQYLLVSFMVSSILINPNLLIFSFALGAPMALARLIVCVSAGVLAGFLVKVCFRDKAILNFDGFEDKKKSTKDSSIIMVFLRDINRAIIKTAPYFFIGILLTAIFEMYFPKEIIIDFFDSNRGFGVLLASSIGVPIYVCGGGTIPLLRAWLSAGMTPGSAIAFMVSGPATKLTNLGAVKVLLGAKYFIIYILFNVGFSVIAGLIVDGIYAIIK